MKKIEILTELGKLENVKKAIIKSEYPEHLIREEDSGLLTIVGSIRYVDRYTNEVGISIRGRKSLHYFNLDDIRCLYEYTQERKKNDK